MDVAALPIPGETDPKIPSSPTAATTTTETDLSTQLTSLRAQLKEWEKTFSSAHSGRKPGRDDIKNDQSGIGKIYKEYNRLRDIADGKPAKDASKKSSRPPSRREKGDEDRHRRDSLKRKHKDESEHHKEHRHEHSTHDHQRKVSITSTPRKIASILPYDPPSSVTPKPLKSFIGPTPQRDGKVLGLFDLLSASRSKDTPSGHKRKADVLGEGDSNMAAVQTPSRKKQTGDILDYLDGEGGNTGRREKFQRTPASEGKKFLLSQFFATPSTARFMNEEEDTTNPMDKTPLRTKLFAGREEVKMDAPEPEPDATPTFLRRSTSLSQRLLAESTNVPPLSFASPEKVRTGPSRMSLFKKGRSLSEMVKNLRQIQDDQHDDDWEAMNEMEAELDVQVEGSQQDTEEPQRIWKKKGQKRTTRRINMKPPSAKPKSKSNQPEGDGSDEDDAEEVVTETQAASMADASDEFDDDIDFELIPSDDEAISHPPATEKPASKSTAQPSTAPNEKKGRKVKANAISHMNFRSLKIKNKNSKAKGRGFGRFGGRGRR